VGHVLACRGSGRKLLDSARRIGDIDAAVSAYGDTPGEILDRQTAAKVELAGASSRTTPLGDIVAVEIEDLYTLLPASSSQ